LAGPKLDIGVEVTAEDEKIMRGEGVEAPAEQQDMGGSDRPPDTAAAEKPEQAAVEPAAESVEQPRRDEQGRPAEKAAAPDVKQQDDEPKFVPLAALKEERLKRQEAEKRAEERQNLLEERLKLLAERIKPKDEPKAPTVEENPIEVLKQTQQQLQQVQQLQVHQAQRLQFANHVAAQVNSFKGQTPDYDAAYKFAVESTRQELRARGFPEEQIPAILENGEFQLAQEALQRGKNPGQHFYEFAQARGYRKPEPAPPQAVPVPDKLATIEKGQQAARSLGSMGGGAAPKKTLETLISMSEAEIAAMPQDELERILRG